ncbi:Ubiquitin-like-conjugating enzyme Atg3/Atg10 [Dillenia turbinata]|uniref:Ubiquitin-like-conjugating enzyme Atg3/Atg10 n=1 Tax=Dillenia turbinata TaxID=194707 RepID=A0AAN8Z0V2_9MAGN
MVICRESGEPSKRKTYLPPEKQYLITRNVPCLRRAASVEEEYEAAGGEVLLDNDDNDGWLATHGKLTETKGDVEENLPSMETLEISKNNTIKSISSYLGDVKEEDIPDISKNNTIKSARCCVQTCHLLVHSSFILKVEMHDSLHTVWVLLCRMPRVIDILYFNFNKCRPRFNLHILLLTNHMMITFCIPERMMLASLISVSVKIESKHICVQKMAMVLLDRVNVLELGMGKLPMMSEDVLVYSEGSALWAVGYNKYYQTPRVWLTGYDESRRLLEPELVLEDVSQDHAHKTKGKPNALVPQILRSPPLAWEACFSASMSTWGCDEKIIDVLMSHGVEPEVDKYLFLFLKFVASVIPTIEYDYTMDFDLGSSGN